MADPVTWYSAALRAAEKLPQNFGTAEQMQRMLEKYGAKQSELKYLKVPEYLSQFGGGRVSKNALADYIGKNVVLPKEVQKSGPGEWNLESAGDFIHEIAGNDTNWTNFDGYLSNRGLGPDDLDNFTPIERIDWMIDHDDLVQQYLSDNGRLGGTKYSDYATYPSSDYKETLVTLPRRKLSIEESAKQMAGGATTKPWTEISAADRQEFLDLAKEMQSGEYAEYTNPLYQSSHWDEPNVLLHLRSSAPLHEDPAMGYLPYLEELQSDWGQAGRRKGFKFKTREQIRQEMDDIFKRGVALEPGPEQNALLQQYHDLNNRQMDAAINGVHPAPLVTNTQDWSAAGIRRFLLDAARKDAPQIAWTTGAQQAARYSGHAPEGMSGYYDKIIPSIINKYVKPYGGKVELAPPMIQPPDKFVYNLDEFNANRARYERESAQPHTATLPEALRRKLRDEGIPFFSHGGYVSA